MGQALYRKHRPKRLSEIVGQDHITTTLENALSHGRISHAYLFTGPRGVGKTSIARILAHEINSIPYDEDATHLDIIEIDAASNRRIDEIRELRERVHSAPTSAKFKVYIIDEVHMLTKEAFNALLKTLEEPPTHVIFILATTEAHKLPETIISRTQRFTFKPVEHAKVVSHLSRIAKQEHINITVSALELIAEHGGGSFRDSISLLDQAGNQDSLIELSDVQQMLGIAPDQVIEDLTNILQNGSIAELVELISNIQSQGLQPVQIAKQLAARLRTSLVTEADVLLKPQASNLLHKLLYVSASHDPAATLELTLIDVIINRSPTAEKVPEVVNDTIVGPPIEKTTKFQKLTQKNNRPTPPTTHAELPKNNIVASNAVRAENVVAVNSLTAPLNDEVWQNTLNEIKKTHNTLYGVARMAVPKFSDTVLILNFEFSFHQKRLNEAKNKQVISDVISRLTGTNIEIVCRVDKKEAPLAAVKIDANAAKSKTSGSNNSSLDTISNIFGSAEIIE